MPLIDILQPISNFLLMLSNITSVGKLVAKLWLLFCIQDGRQQPTWIFEIRKLRHQSDRPRKPNPITKHPVSILYTTGVMIV